MQQCPARYGTLWGTERKKPWFITDKAMALNTEIFARLIVCLFIGIIALPGFLSLLAIDTASSLIDENRQLAPFPDIGCSPKAIVQFPRDFDRYFSEHFRLRDHFILGYNWLKIKIWKRSSQKKVLIGTAGWLFLADDRVLEDFLSMQRFSVAQLEARRRNLESKRDWLAKQGIRYLFVIPPNKQSIYTEFMPKAYRHLQGPSRLDQFLSYMDQHSDVDILDLRPTLRKAKEDQQVYFSLDSHWNELGGFVASREILGHIFDPHRVKTLNDYRIRTEKRHRQGDLSRLLGYPLETSDNCYSIEPEFDTISSKQQLPNYLGRDWKPYPPPFVSSGPRNGLNCVVFHDSFAIYFAPFFPELFERSLFVWQRNPTAELFKAVVEKERPDIVVEEVVERLLYYYETGPQYLVLG